jgi:hypothetical protein
MMRSQTKFKSEYAIYYISINIYNRSLATSEFSACLNCADVKPLLKSGNNSELSNCRPISVLT